MNMEHWNYTQTSKSFVHKPTKL